MKTKRHTWQSMWADVLWIIVLKLLSFVVAIVPDDAHGTKLCESLSEFTKFSLENPQ